MTQNIAVFASGSGSNYEAIMKNFLQTKWRKGKVALVVCDQPDAYVLHRAKKWQTPAMSISLQHYESKKKYEQEILKQLQHKQIDFIVLAGYMRLIGPTLLEAYSGRMMNIHPSLLPAFPGLDAIGQAWQYGVRITGVTVHFVDEGMDTGPIIEQQAVPVTKEDTRESLQQKIQNVEHALYPEVIKACVEEQIKEAEQSREISLKK